MIDTQKFQPYFQYFVFYISISQFAKKTLIYKTLPMNIRNVENFQTEEDKREIPNQTAGAWQHGTVGPLNEISYFLVLARVQIFLTNVSMKRQHLSYYFTRQLHSLLIYSFIIPKFLLIQKISLSINCSFFKIINWFIFLVFNEKLWKYWDWGKKK